jgi:WD40 repeat protein
LVTTGFDGLAVVWDWQTDRAPNVLKVHDSYVYRACFARHHTNWLVTCSFDRKARIWDLRTGRWIVEVEHEGDAVIDAQLSPDDRVLVTGGLDASVRLWSAETGRLVPPLMRSHERVKQVCWSADGRHLAAITWGGVGRVWRFEQYRREQPTTDEWSPDGNYSLSRGPGTLTFKDTAKGVATHLTNAALSESPVRFAGGPERFLSFVPRAGQAGATNSGGSVLKGAQVRLWESATGKAIGKPLELANSFRMVSAPQGRRFAFLQAAVLEGNQEAIHEILVWDPSNENPERRLTFSDEGIESLAFDPNGQRLAVGSHSLSGGERVLRLIDLKGDAEPEALYRSSQNIVQIAFSKDGRWLAAACATPALDPGEALVWRIPRAGGRFTEPNHLRHPDGVLDVAFSDSCQALATASEDQTALVWRLSRGDWKPALRPLRCSGKVLLSAFSHHERWLATASRTPRAQQSGTRDCQVRIWDAANNEPVSLPWEFSRLVTGLIFLDNDKALLVECWEPPQEPVRWLIPLPTGSGDPGELLVKAQLLSAQKSFLSGGSHLFEHTRDGLLSAEEALSYAMSVAPVRPLTTHECEQLWLLMPRSKPRF